MTIQDINQKIQDIQTALSANPDGRAKELLEQGLQTFQSLLVTEQKKSESQLTGKPEQLQRTPIRDAAAKVPQEIKDEVKAWADAKQLRTIKAPIIERESEYINIELTDQKGQKYIRTYNRAQVKSLCRKYFSNVHESWMNGNKKMGTGFENLLTYFIAWVEFDECTPTLKDVLLHYGSYKKPKEQLDSSEAFKVAQQLYDKIILIISEKSSINEA